MEELKNLAIIDPSSPHNLLKFYQQKVSNLEKERIDWITELNTLKIDQKEKHDTEWKIFRLKNEKEEFERKISDLKIKFFQEQSFVINLKNEKNDLLKTLKKEQKKVKELLAHIQPVSEKIILREGKKPKFHYKFIKTSSNLDSIQKLKDKYIHKDKPGKFSLRSKVVIENQFFENDLKNCKDLKNFRGKKNGACLKKKNQNCSKKINGVVFENKMDDCNQGNRNKKDKNEFKKVYDFKNDENWVMNDLRGIKKNDVVNIFEKKYINKINQLENENLALKKQNELLEKEIYKSNEKNKQNFDEYQNDTKKLLSKNFKIEKINIDLNKNFFEQRALFSEKEKRYEEEIEILKIKLLNFNKMNSELNYINENEKKYSKKLFDSKKNEFLKDYKNKLKEKEANLEIVKTQYQQIQKIFKTKLDNFFEENKILKEKLMKYKNYENLKSEGLKTENGFLKKKLEELNENLNLINSIKKKKRISQSQKNLKKAKSKIKEKNLFQKTLQKKRK